MTRELQDAVDRVFPGIRAELAAVDAGLQRPHLDDGIHEAAQAHSERGTPDGPVLGIRDHNRVRRQPIAEGVQERGGVWRAQFLLAFHDHGHADGQR